MFNNPQCPVEEIELIPHPMDAWRAALNALIACAPGDGAAIAAHLAEARQRALVSVDRSHATAGVAKMVDRLMLLGAGRIVGERLANQTNSASLTRRVTNRLTVVVNGNDYDVSATPGVMVGDMLRIDPNNLPPALNREAVPGGSFQPLPGSSQLAAETRAARCQPGVPGTEQPAGSPADARHESVNLPAAAEHPAPAQSAVSRPAPHTPALAPQLSLPAHQNTDRS